MKKLIKILFCFILIASVLCTMPAYANYNAVYEKSLTDSGDNPIYAQIYLLVNLDNDTVIFEKNADKQAAPASLTKIMTATVVLENCKDLDEEVEASYEAIHLLDGTGSSIVGLEPGREDEHKESALLPARAKRQRRGECPRDACRRIYRRLCQDDE